ncbi:hypothetical protein C7389_11639 [Azoarcus indigens]|uniref:Uncharacterized protein n=1 Tax=Azoarcus indigens TaxID=29545 RepID=A0A4R6DTY1_9RHOO|nr:hypothetical protein C7389_11639 [Azoarcus indigens]
MRLAHPILPAGNTKPAVPETEPPPERLANA